MDQPTKRNRNPGRPTRPRGRPRGRTVADGVIAGRETLLQAAESLIRREGPKVSLAAIAAAANVTKPILYRELGDKDKLVSALAERLAARMTASIEEQLAQAAGPRDGLRRVVSTYLNLATRDQHLYLFITAGGASENRVQQALMLADGAAEEIMEPIANYRAAHGADPEVARVWAYGLLGTLQFVTLWWLRDQVTDRDRVIDHVTALLWSGIGLEDGVL